MIADVFNEFIPKDYSIVELGCNIGRNLEYLSQRGYNNLMGVEINKAAYQHRVYPNILNTTVELAVFHVKADVVFTCAFFEHLHPESEGVFWAIENWIKPEYVITLEDELYKSPRHFPRNYEKVFNCYDQVYVKNCQLVRGLNYRFMLRVQRRKT